MDSSNTFSFETVFSHPDKVKFIQKANKKGFRSYLYFVSTESVDININRINQRVQLGGHRVPKKKIIERYHRSMDHLYSALKISYRSYIFDNSGKNLYLFATVNLDKTITFKDIDKIPIWFQTYVINKMPLSDP